MRQFLFFLILFHCFQISNGQTNTPLKSFKVDSTNFEYTGGIQINNEFLVVGNQVLQKLDSNANNIWMKKYYMNGGTLMFLNIVADKFDSNNAYILMKHKNKEGIIKINLNGDILFSKFYTYDSVTYLKTNSITTSYDGKLLLMGVKDSCLMITKIDSNGIILWQNKYTTPLNEFMNGGYILELQNHRLMVCTNIYNKTTNKYQGVLIKIDENGNFLWNKMFALNINLPYISALTLLKPMLTLNQEIVSSSVYTYYDSLYESSISTRISKMDTLGNILVTKGALTAGIIPINEYPKGTYNILNKGGPIGFATTISPSLITTEEDFTIKNAIQYDFDNQPNSYDPVINNVIELKNKGFALFGHNWGNVKFQSPFFIVDSNHHQSCVEKSIDVAFFGHGCFFTDTFILNQVPSNYSQNFTLYDSLTLPYTCSCDSEIYANFEFTISQNQIICTNLSSSNVVKYKWNEGYPVLSTIANPIFTYNDTNRHKITLTVETKCKKASITKYISILDSNRCVRTEYIKKCANQSYTYPDGSPFFPGYEFHSSYFNGNGTCDSIIVTIIGFRENNFNITLEGNCGEDYILPSGDTVFNNANNFFRTKTVLYTSSFGCDSTVDYTIHFSHYRIIDTVNICTNTSSYTFPDGFTIAQPSDFFSHTFYTYACNDCASKITRYLHIRSPQLKYDTNYVCYNSNFIFPDSTVIYNLQSDTSYVSYLQNIYLCDSIIYTYLKVVQSYSIQDTGYTCFGNNYTFHDSTTLNNNQNDTMHTSVFQTIYGCDSILNTYLQVNPFINLTDTFTVCKGDNFTFHDGIILSSLQYDTLHINNFINANNCDSNIHTYLKLQFVDTLVFQSNDTLFANANIQSNTFQWLDCEHGLVIIPNATQNYFHPNTNGGYAVITTNNGCSDTSNCHSVKNLAIQSANDLFITIFPNPTSSICTIANNSNKEIACKLSLYNSQFQLLVSENIYFNKGANKFEINLSKFSSGTYICNLVSQNGENYYFKICKL